MNARTILFKLLPPVLFLAAGILLGRISLNSPAFISSTRETREGGYQFINPLLECDASESSFLELKPFDNRIKALVSDKINKSNGGVNYVAVYFRDLNNGPWFGVNENDTFSPASLLKVPLAMSYLRWSQNDPSILGKSYVFKKDNSLPDVAQFIKPSKVLEDGKKYRVDDLVSRMLIYSDNYAQHVLVQNMNLDIFKKVYIDFGLSVPDAKNPDTQISVKTYAGFFRVLFNASYLSKQDSEMILKLLAESDYRDGLVAGVPADITVAHKFGEREIMGSSDRQLHDCGIVYYPGRPYLICIMTRGTDYAALSGTIRDVSSLVYGEVKNQKQ
jgi:beta-lactamase class A